MTNEAVQIIPLGGVGEFGMNMMLIRCDGEAIIIDAGMGFPEDEPGINILIPDFSLIDKYRDEIVAIFLTHGHEDHIGAVPFLLKEIDLPVYGTRLTLARVENKLVEHGLLKTTVLHPIDKPETIQLKTFAVDFINVSHSLNCSTAIAIRTPVGVLLHSGDFKIDKTPVLGESIDLEAITRYGDSGVLALFSDSTNAEWPGFTPSERAVIPELRRLFDGATGRIILTCFTTSTHRLQIVLDLAEEFDRKVLLLGRSMIQNIETIGSLRLLDVPDDILVSVAQAKKLPDDRLVLLVAGSQGEPRSAMTRIATDQVKGISVGPGDLVIHSARVIPGKERAISRMISHCYRRGARVVDKSIAAVHVSGHASQEELAIMIRATRPKFLIPIHGEHRQLYRHKEFAETLGIVEPGNIIMFENGDVLELDGSTARIAGKEVVGRTFIDSAGGEVENIVVRDRRHLSYDGVLVSIVAINPTSGELDSDPEIVTRGFIDQDEASQFLSALRTLIVSTVEAASHESRIDAPVMQEEIRLALKRFIRKQTGRQPMIISVVLDF
ncbi:MAG: ribonuclease [Blastocatellia bacterium]|jgi:ribonuclease J|nr:ribonuclease [Blastocatellia bacterium]